MKTCILFLLSIISLSISAQIVPAKKDSLLSPTQLEEVIVTTKIKQSKINIARIVENILVENEIKKGNNTMHSILNTVSGVYMVDMGNEQLAMSIRLPINYSPLYNYLEEGIPLRPVGIFNNNELLEINRFATQKIEIIKGPFSSGYGSHSIGASINFIQKNNANAKNQVSFQSNGFGHTETVFQFKKNIGSYKLFVNLNHSQRNVNSAYHFNYTKQAATIILDKTINSKNTLSLKHNTIIYNGDQRDGYDSATFYKRNYNSFDKFSDRKTNVMRTSITWNYFAKSTNNYKLTFFNRILSEKQNPFYLISYNYANPLDTNATGQITKDKFTSYGISVENNRTINNKLKFNQNLYIDFTPKNIYTSNFIKVKRSNLVNESYTNTDSLLTYYKANLKNIAYSASLQYMPTSKIIIFGSLRADLLSFKFKNYLPASAYSGSASGTNGYYSINPELSFLYKLSKWESAFIQFGKGFTPPTLSNLYRGVKTPNLVPTKYYNYEVGYKFIKNNTSIEASIYNMVGKDEFVNVIRTTGTEIVNAGKTLHQGIELQVRQTTKKITVSFAPSIQKHIYKSYSDYGVNYDGNKMNGAPTYLHNLNVSYNIGTSKNIILTADWTKVGPYYIDQSNTKKYNGYDLFNLKSAIIYKNLLLNVGINNILNTIYATNADGTYGIRYYPGLKRTLQAGVTLNF